MRSEAVVENTTKPTDIPYASCDNEAIVPQHNMLFVTEEATVAKIGKH